MIYNVQKYTPVKTFNFSNILQLSQACSNEIINFVFQNHNSIVWVPMGYAYLCISVVVQQQQVMCGLILGFGARQGFQQTQKHNIS